MITDIRNIMLTVLSDLSSAGFSIGVGFGSEPVPLWAHSTYDESWINHYVVNNFVSLDPTITHCANRPGYYTWAELEEMFPENPVLAAAHEFGLTEGNTISMKIGGVTTIASCSGAAWTEEEITRASAAISSLHFMAKPKVGRVSLKSHTIEVLQLMADGIRDREIAERQGVKLETVRLRRKIAYEQTGTGTQAELISFAIKNGVI